MALFKSRRSGRVLDLTEKYKKELNSATQVEPAVESVAQQTESNSGFNFLGSMASGVQPTEPQTDVAPVSSEGYESAEQKRKKLTKRLMDMTSQIETLSNQIYHLQQRIEVLERKSGIRME